MVTNLWPLAFWAAVTFATPLIFTLPPFIKARASERVLHLMLGFSAGVLGSLAFVEILPEAFEFARDMEAPAIYVSIGVALGFFSLLIVERYLLGADEEHGGHFHIHTEPVLDPRHGIMGVSALTIHGFMDGFVIPISFSVSPEVGLVVALAIVIHQIPDSFAALSLALNATSERGTRFLYVFLTAIDTPLGIAMGLALAGLGPHIIPVGLGFVAGTFVYVSATDLIPELRHRARSPLVILSMILGFSIIMMISLMVPPG